jgi:hypothetical protein
MERWNELRLPVVHLVMHTSAMHAAGLPLTGVERLHPVQDLSRNVGGSHIFPPPSVAVPDALGEIVVGRGVRLCLRGVVTPSSQGHVLPLLAVPSGGDHAAEGRDGGGGGGGGGGSRRGGWRCGIHSQTAAKGNAGVGRRRGSFTAIRLRAFVCGCAWKPGVFAGTAGTVPGGTPTAPRVEARGPASCARHPTHGVH